jgi:hypothetical protein
MIISYMIGDQHVSMYLAVVPLSRLAPGAGVAVIILLGENVDRRLLPRRMAC